MAALASQVEWQASAQLDENMAGLRAEAQKPYGTGLFEAAQQAQAIRHYNQARAHIGEHCHP